MAESALVSGDGARTPGLGRASGGSEPLECGEAGLGERDLFSSSEFLDFAEALERVGEGDGDT